MRLRSSCAGSLRAIGADVALRLLRRQVERAAEDRLDHRHHVGGFGDQRRALLEQAVGAFGARIERRARHGEDLAALFAAPCRAVISEPERRAASTTTTPSDRPEISRLRRGKSRARGSQPSGISRHGRAARAAMRFEQADMLGRIDAVVAAGEHRDRAGREARAMRGGIDAARQARDDARSRRSPRSRASRSANFTPARRGIARADDGDQRPRQHGGVAAHREQRRRVVDHAQARGIVRLAERDERDAACAARPSVRARPPRAEQMRPGRAAPPRRASSGRASSARRAPPKWLMSVAEGARADIVAADEAQPVEPLRVGQANAASRAGHVHGADGLLADRVLGAAHEPRDVGAVHDPTAAPSARRTAARRCGRPRATAATGVSGAGDQRGERRVARQRGDREPDRAEDRARPARRSPSSTPI